MNISQAQIDQYIRDGAVVVDGLISPETIDAAEAEMDALYAADVENPTGIRQYNKGPGFERLFQEAGLEEAAKNIIGSEHVHILASATLHTLPNAECWSYDGETEHVDIQYTLADWHNTPRQIIVTFMIFLDDVTPERAPTVARIGSHLQLAEYNGDKAYQEKPVNLRDLPALDYAEPTPLCGKRGQVAASTTALVHTGSLNASNKARKIVFLTFADRQVSPPFNINIADQRLAWMQDIQSRMPSDKKHLFATSIAMLEQVIETAGEKVNGGSFY